MFNADFVFDSFQPEINALHAEVEGALSTFCASRNFLLVGRKKTLESFREKIESGRYGSVQSIDDLVAFSVIIDVRSQQREVESFLRKIFRVEFERKKTTLVDERQFDFDCARFYCRLIKKGDRNIQLSKWLFEVQIRTILQHAWSKITHSRVYKAERFDARKARLAAEMMAHIETADRIFATFDTSARGVKSISRREMEFNRKIIDRIDKLIRDGLIPNLHRPQNGRRLAESIAKSIKKTPSNVDKAIDIIEQFIRSLPNGYPMSVSLFQIVMVALHESNLLDNGHGRQKRYYPVDDGLIAIFPSANGIKNRFDTASE